MNIQGHLCLYILLSLGCVPMFGTQPTDSLYKADCHADTLTEVSVVAIGPRKTISIKADGSLSIDARLLSDETGLAGASDPIALLRTLPAVSTTGELNAELNVRGSNNGANTFLADGARVVNPMHILGIYSAFNSSFFNRYNFAASRHNATSPNATSAIFEALSPDLPIAKPKGEISVGIIESHGALHLPLFKQKGLLSIGGRQTYLSLLFPNILQLGTSKLRYGFTDINASYTHFIGNDNIVKASIFLNNDHLNAEDRHNGSKDGSFGWGNTAANIQWSNSGTKASLSYTTFNNKFQMTEAGRYLDLPSTLSQVCAVVTHQVRNVLLEADATWRQTSGQYNRALNVDGKSRQSDAFEGNLAASWHHRLGDDLDITAGLRMALYSCGDYHKVAPMPRIQATYEFSKYTKATFSVGRYMRFDRLVEESTTGLPVDFYINCSSQQLPEDTWAAELSVSGSIPGVWLEYSVEGYAKRLLHSGEFAGSILDLLSASYNPLSDLIDGNGYAYGLSVSIARQFGPLRGRIGYNIGKSRLKFERYGDQYFPSSHDRLHDFSATVLWNPWAKLTLGVTFTHATGTPYTKAKYGYIIAENLICEYYPHNSSRLPSYNRLDFSASLKLGKHGINLSIYNVLANRNILFLYTSYSLLEGIQYRESVMKTIIPSVSYSYYF